MARLFDDGSSEYLRVGSAVVAALPMTLSAWFYSDDGGIDQTLVGISDGVANGFILQAGGVGSNEIIAGSIDGGVADYALSTAFWFADTWHHACAVFSTTTLRAAFLDGAGKGTQTDSNNPSGVDQTDIGQIGNGSSYISGRIAEAAIWDVALTDAEVAVLAKGYSPLFVRAQSLVAYWPLIRDEDQDRVGGYDLTAYNTPSIATHPPIIYPAPPSFFIAPAAAAADAMPMAMDLYRFRRAA